MNYKHLIFKISFLFFLFSAFCLFNYSASAGSVCVSKANPGTVFDSLQACQTVYTDCSCSTPATEIASKGTPATEVKPQTLPNPLGIVDINAFIARIINFVLSLVGSVSLLLFVYGGITWMTSVGNQAQIKKGKDIIIWAVIGLAVVFTSYILVKFVIQGITT